MFLLNDGPTRNVLTGLDFGRRQKTTCAVETCPAMTSPMLDERRRDTAVLDASLQELRMNPAVTAGDTESTEIQMPCHTDQHPAFTIHTLTSVTHKSQISLLHTDMQKIKATVKLNYCINSTAYGVKTRIKY